MVLVRFVDSAGTRTDVAIPEGVSVMEGAISAGIEGIDADCGGQLSCATCHVYLEQTWAGLVPPPSDDEEALLDFAADRQQNSRLSCQIFVKPELDGLEIEVPARQAS